VVVCVVVRVLSRVVWLVLCVCVCDLAYTRYCFVYGLLCQNQYYSLHTHPLFSPPPPSLPSSPILLRNIIFFPDPPLLQYILHTIGHTHTTHTTKTKTTHRHRTAKHQSHILHKTQVTRTTHEPSHNRTHERNTRPNHLAAIGGYPLALLVVAISCKSSCVTCFSSFRWRGGSGQRINPIYLSLSKSTCTHIYTYMYICICECTHIYQITPGEPRPASHVLPSVLRWRGRSGQRPVARGPLLPTLYVNVHIYIYQITLGEPGPASHVLPSVRRWRGGPGQRPIARGPLLPALGGTASRKRVSC